MYDYFEELFKKEIYNNEIRDVYLLAKRAIDKIGKKRSLECKIVKTLCLLYILQQFEKIKPVKEEIFRIYKNEYKETIRTFYCHNITFFFHCKHIRTATLFLVFVKRYHKSVQ